MSAALTNPDVAGRGPEAAPGRSASRLSRHLAELESEAVYILRETAALFERPAILFSGGKDSILLAHLARKAFWPGRLPFPLLHVDTGHNFPETIAFRDRLADSFGAQLVVRTVEASIDAGRAREEPGPNPSRNGLQTITLLDALRELRIDAALGGGRRDEEKARAKERIFSHRDAFGQWDPKNQRPELWSLFNAQKNPGEHFRVFPLSNWAEIDVWQYVAAEGIELPSLYFSHEREVVRRDGVLLAIGEHNRLLRGERSEVRRVRCRTIGDVTCTGLWESDARTVEEIVREVAAARVTERGSRSDDRRGETAMEDRKRQGYF
jgi:sulfate adenylyltransferase subunit 2